MKTVILLLFLPLMLLSYCQGVHSFRKSNFNYENLYKQNFIYGNGEPVYLTLENDITYSGTISSDHRYLYFSGNKTGNFDIYLRPLDNIENIPILAMSTNQTEPVISPDGTKLLFIDDEIDPDGDLTYVELDPADLLDTYYEEGEAAAKEELADERVFLTNTHEKRFRSKESNPAFSPDGKIIAYASNRREKQSNFGPGYNAQPEIWLMHLDAPEKTRRLTKTGKVMLTLSNEQFKEQQNDETANLKIDSTGAIMPSFSPQEKRLVYVNLNQGDSDIYEINLKTGEKCQITSGEAIDLSPSYGPNNNTIFYTRIAKDTNLDGKINQKDNGTIMRYSRPKNQSSSTALDETQDGNLDQSGRNCDTAFHEHSHELTLNNQNLFNTRYSSFMSGVVTFALTEGNNINLAFIPATGIIARKGNSEKQLAYAKELLQKKEETQEKNKVSQNKTRLAIESVDFGYPKELTPYIYTAQRDFLLYNRETNPGKKKKIFQKIHAGAQKNPFYRFLLDLYYYDNAPERLNSDPSLFRQLQETPKELSQEAYLNWVIENSQELIAPEQRNNSKAVLTVTGAVYEIVAQTYVRLGEKCRVKNKKNKTKCQNLKNKAHKLYYRLISNFPDYHKNIEILYLLGEENFKAKIPVEYLFLLYPEKYTLERISPEISKEEVNESSEQQESFENERKTQKINEIHKKLQAAITPEIKLKVENSIYRFFRQSPFQSSPLIQTHPEIDVLAKLAKLDTLIQNKKYKEARALAGAITPPQDDTKWGVLLWYLKSRLALAKKNYDQTSKLRLKALSQYQKEFQIREVEGSINKVLAYYRKKALNTAGIGDYETAWKTYENLTELIVTLYTREITTPVSSSLALQIFIELDKMVLTILDAEKQSNRSQTRAIRLYNRYIDQARAHLINPLIFGRAYLNVMTGIRLHTSYEKGSLLDETTKEEVFILFKEAELDLHWSIYTDSQFSDAYLMLGWMYQFIDEKRESVSLQGTTKIKDKDKYPKLYERYFPQYLFEKNIALYQKILSFKRKSGADKQSSESIYLNMANNYFLLNNYIKAEEYYKKITLFGKKRYKFESNLQKAQYYFHMGKSQYFNNHSREADQNLQIALSLYPAYNKKKSARLNLFEIERRLEQREIILKYLALNSKTTGDARRAIQYYRQITNEQKEANYERRSPDIYLEIAALSYQEAQRNHDRKLLKTTTFPALKRARTLLLQMPVNKVNDPTYYIGDSQLIYKLPTIHLYQYFYSIKADALILHGNLGEAGWHLGELIKYAQMDKTDHGIETLISATMRLGEVFYNLGMLADAREQYEQAIEIALDEEISETQRIARKNLLTITCFELEHGNLSLEEKIELAEDELESLKRFRSDYEETKIESAREEARQKNDKIELSAIEIAEIRQASTLEISSVQLYEGVLLALLARFRETRQLSQNKKTNFKDYYKSKQELYNDYWQSLKALEGYITINQKPIYLLKTTDRRMELILSLNRANVYEGIGNYEKAKILYEEVYKGSKGYGAKGLMAYSGVRLYIAQKKLNETPSLDSLEKANQIFNASPSIRAKYPGEYRYISNYIISENLKNKNYTRVIYQSNLNRYKKALWAMRPQLALAPPEIKESLQRYHNLSRKEETVENTIQQVRLMGDSSTAYEKKLNYIKTEKEKIRNDIRQNPLRAPFAIALFEEFFTEDEIKTTRYRFVWLLRDLDKIHLIRNNPSNATFQHDSYQIKTKELARFMKAHQNEKDKEPLAGELKRLVQNIKRLNPDILFCNDEFWPFPFAEYTGRETPREYTLQAAQLLGQNSNLSINSWVSVHSARTSSGEFIERNPLFQSFTFYKQNSYQDVLKNPGKYNVLDIEFKAPKNKRKLSSKNSFGALFFQEFSPSVVFVSSAGKTPSPAMMGGINLFFAAQGATAILHTMKPRSDSQELIIDFLSPGAETQTGNWLYSANSEVFSSLRHEPGSLSHGDFQNLNNKLQKEIKSHLHRAKLHESEETSQKALSSIRRGEQAHEFGRLYQSYLKNPEEFSSGKEVEPHPEIVKAQIRLLIQSEKLNDAEKLFQNYLEYHRFPEEADPSATEEADQPQKPALEYDLKDISLIRTYLLTLIHYGHLDRVISHLKFFEDYPRFDAKELRRYLDAAALRHIQQGRLDEVVQNWEKLLPIPGLNERINDLPQEAGFSGKVDYLIKHSKRKHEWFKALISSGELSRAISYINTTRNKKSKKRDSYAGFWDKTFIIDLYFQGDYAKSGLLKADEMKYFKLSTKNKIDNWVQKNNDPLLASYAYIRYYLYKRDLNSAQNELKEFLQKIDQNDTLPQRAFETIALKFLQTTSETRYSKERLDSILDTLLKLSAYDKSSSLQTEIFIETIKNHTTANIYEAPQKMTQKSAYLSEVNRLLYNRLAYIALQIYPEKMSDFTPIDLDFLYTAYKKTVSANGTAIQKIKKLQKNLAAENPQINTRKDMIQLIKRHIGNKNSYEALKIYAMYDRKEELSTFHFQRELAGLIRSIPGEYLAWVYSKERVVFTILSDEDLPSWAGSQKEKIIYIPAKEELPRRVVFHSNLYSATFLKVPSSEEFVLTWTMTGKSLSPLESMLYIKFGKKKPLKREQKALIAAGPYGGNSLIHISDTPYLSLKEIKPDEFRGYRIASTGAPLNVYYRFLKAYIAGLHEKNLDPLKAFEEAQKKVEALYHDTNASRSIVLIHH